MNTSDATRFPLRTHIRNIIHVVVHVSIGFIMLFSPLSAIIIMSLCLVFMLWQDITRLRSDKIKRKIEKESADIVKPWELFRISAPTWSVVGMFVLIFFYYYMNIPIEIAALALIILGIADPAAGLCRSKFNYKHLPGNRLIGSIVFFIISIIVLGAFSCWMKNFPKTHFPCEILIIAGIAALTEFLSFKHIEDNVTVPLSVVIAFSIIWKVSIYNIHGILAVSSGLIVFMFMINYLFYLHFSGKYKSS